MAIPTDPAGILSALGLPTGAGVVAFGLIKGADFLEADAKEERLKEISDLLKDTSITSLSKLGAFVVPFVFQKIFGSKALSLKFVSRSILASVIFWFILLAIKHANVGVILSGLISSGEWPNLLVILFADWLSLAKAKLILGQMLRQVEVFWMSVFVIADLASTLALFWIISVLYGTAITLLPGLVGLPPVVARPVSIQYLSQVLIAESTISASFFSVAVVDYFTAKPITYLTQVAGPSTMFTSIWVVLFFISILVLKLLAPLEYLRRFTIWWSKDIDAHPLRAIAKVAATLIVIGGVALTLVRWGWMMI